jgi:hypothetical protein
MSEAVTKNIPSAGASALAPRLFVLELNAGRIHSMNTDGSDRKTIVSNCHLPDGIVVDVEAGHIYWTNMGIPNLNDGSVERADKRGKLSFSHIHGASNMVRYKIAAVAVTLSALAARSAFPQAAIQEPGAFEFYHPNDDVLNGGAPTPAAGSAWTARAQGAHAAIGDASIADREVGKGICDREPRVGAFASQPWSNGRPCEPAVGY